MMKFFRKHNKKLIAIFMSLLMVVFIGGSALQKILMPSRNRLVATSNLGDITEQNQRNITELTKLMGSMGLNWQQPIRGIGGDKPLQEIDWILLSRETKRLGMMMDPSLVAAGANNEKIQQMARVLRVKTEEILKARAIFDDVVRTAKTLAIAATPDEATVRARTRDVLETVQIDAVVLPAKMFLDDSLTFSDDELQAQFDKYKAKEKGAGLDFGYYQEPRVKVQYVEIDRNKLANEIGIANLEARARHVYDDMVVKHDPSLKRPEDLFPDAAGPKQSPVLSWEEAKDKVIEKVKQDDANETAKRIAGWIIQKDSNVWLDGTRKDNGYLPAPDGVDDDNYYQKMIADLPRDINYPDAITVRETDFFTQQGAGDVGDIGASHYKPLRGPTIPFRRLPFLTESMVPTVPKDAQNRSEYTATYETYTYPMTDQDGGHMFVFRVVGSEDGHPADSLDEVRDEVVADLRLLRAFEKAKAQAETLRSSAIEKGLKAAYDADKKLVALRDTPAGKNSGYVEPPAFSRLRTYQAATGPSPQGTFLGGGLNLVPNRFVTDCFALADKPDKIAVMPIEERADVFVVQLVKLNPPTEKEFADTRETVLTQMQSEDWRVVLSNWLNPEQIRARTAMKLVTK